MSLFDVAWHQFGLYSHPPDSRYLAAHTASQSAPPASFLAYSLSQISQALNNRTSYYQTNHTMDHLSQDEFERFQQLSNSFEADLPVGEIRSE